MAIRHALVPEGALNAPPSPEAYCPFGGIEALTHLDHHGKYITRPSSSFIVLIGLLLSAVLLKSSFCGWICPFGTLQEMLMGVTRFFRAPPSPSRSSRSDEGAIARAGAGRSGAAMGQVRRARITSSMARSW
jgi:hypothetical protein